MDSPAASGTIPTRSPAQPRDFAPGPKTRMSSRILPAVSRLLIVDDNADIHRDFRKILIRTPDEIETREMEQVIFGKAPNPDDEPPIYEIDSAYQGEEAVELLKAARDAGKPYALAYVDMRMPPGLDGIATIQRLWQVDRGLQVVMCSAFSDYSWAQILEKLGRTDQLVILRKPFDPIEVMQLTQALTDKWALEQKVLKYVEDLENMVAERAHELLERKQMFEFILESVTDVIAIVDEHGHPHYTSPSYAATLGYKPSELAGRTTLLADPADRSKIDAVLRQVVQTRNACSLRYRAPHRDGTLHILEGTVRLVELGDDGPTQLSLVMRDVGHR